MIKSNFNDEPIDILEIVENERYLYTEICELKENFKKGKRKFNQIYGKIVKKQNDYIPISRLDLMIKQLREKGYTSPDIIEREKIKYTLDILYQLRFKISGE